MIHSSPIIDLVKLYHNHFKEVNRKSSFPVAYRQRQDPSSSTLLKLLISMASLLVFAGGTVNAAAAVGDRAAPDALVRTRSVTMLARRRMNAPRAVRTRPAPLAMFLVVAMLVLPRRTMDAT